MLIDNKQAYNMCCFDTTFQLGFNKNNMYEKLAGEAWNTCAELFCYIS